MVVPLNYCSQGPKHFEPRIFETPSPTSWPKSLNCKPYLDLPIVTKIMIPDPTYQYHYYYTAPGNLEPVQKLPAAADASARACKQFLVLLRMSFGMSLLSQLRFYPVQGLKV